VQAVRVKGPNNWSKEFDVGQQPCDSLKGVNHHEFLYTVPDPPPPSFELCAQAKDYAKHHANDSCATFYTDQPQVVWTGHMEERDAGSGKYDGSSMTYTFTRKITINFKYVQAGASRYSSDFISRHVDWTATYTQESKAVTGTCDEPGSLELGPGGDPSRDLTGAQELQMTVPCKSIRHGSSFVAQFPKEIRIKVPPLPSRDQFRDGSYSEERTGHRYSVTLRPGGSN
jgi:hypothetical protein